MGFFDDLLDLIRDIKTLVKFKHWAIEKIDQFYDWRIRKIQSKHLK